MKLRDENFPSVLEIKQTVRDHLGRKHAGQWPADDWLDLGRHWSINIWKLGGRKLITVYHDGLGSDGLRHTDVFTGITIE